jgi:hypothetical protein
MKRFFQWMLIKNYEKILMEYKYFFIGTALLNSKMGKKMGWVICQALIFN